MHNEILYYITYPDGRKDRIVHSFDFRYFFRYELEHLLCRVGFEIEALYCDFSKNPYGPGYPGRELVVVARKP